jgi:hypothetical protein
LKLVALFNQFLIVILLNFYLLTNSNSLELFDTFKVAIILLNLAKLTLLESKNSTFYLFRILEMIVNNHLQTYTIKEKKIIKAHLSEVITSEALNSVPGDHFLLVFLIEVIY